ncbi:hypothetical protein [Clostridium sp. BNL1100]|uniref:hypothetical protein n=1 Tax=Clostridium sp. BNL1100 TaxID=755731 RepID=UPI00024A75C2|nr:hypothetical protein [Clostridium sp. BNL1100]AEY65578.1 hypothetical protein Clo1100_1339 [Clostridium sp. BNL1100]
MDSNYRSSWYVNISSDDILNFIIYVGCAYGLIDKQIYTGMEILWPSKFLNTEATREQWQKWFDEMVNLKLEKIKEGKNPDFLFEEYMPPEFSKVYSPLLRQCCKEVWPMFQEWWYMMAGGKAALNFIERVVSQNLIDINEFQKGLGRKLEPFQLYINLVYTGVSETIDINADNKNLVITSTPISTFTKDWWIKKIAELG